MKAYIARHSVCGKVVAVVVDNPKHKKETARDVARWIRQGDAIESMALEYIPDPEDWCSCWKK